MSNRTLRITIGIALAVIMSLAVILPTTTYAFLPRNYPIIRTAPIGGGGGSSGIGNSGGSSSGYHGPIYQPQMLYAPGGGGGGGTSTFSTSSGNGNSNGQPQAVVTDYSNGVVTQSTPYGTVGHGGVHVPVTSTTSQSTSTTSGQSPGTQVITITKTYTQYVYDTYEVNHYVYYYMYPIIQWVFTLVNIGSQQAPGYHSVGNQLVFLPGSGSGGIFVPVFAQEAVYTYNIAPSTKPQITGWYTGKTSQSTSGPFLVSQSSTPPQLTGVQDAVNNAGQAVSNIQQLATSSGNGLSSKTYVYYGNGGGSGGSGGNGGTNTTGPTPSPTPNPQPPTNPESWITFWKAGPGGVGGTTVTNYGPGGVTVTYKPPVFGSPPSLPPITLPPGLLPPGVNSPPPDKFIHNSGALAGVPINGAPPSIPISGLGNVLSGVGNAILNGVENGLKWLHL